jgi:hypothetical protein
VGYGLLQACHSQPAIKLTHSSTGIFSCAFNG